MVEKLEDTDLETGRIYLTDFVKQEWCFLFKSRIISGELSKVNQALFHLLCNSEKVS